MNPITHESGILALLASAASTKRTSVLSRDDTTQKHFPFSLPPVLYYFSRMYIFVKAPKILQQETDKQVPCPALKSDD